MRVFCASVATETNTFSPLRTDFTDFAESFYAGPGAHPETPTLCSAVFPVLRRYARAGEIELIEGTACWAEPGGMINEKTWLRLRDEVLDQLRAALPVDAVVLGLHGAMISEGTLDPEGELLAACRAIVGPKAIIGVTFDPHSHLSARRVENADIITAFKEFPHTDFVRTAEDCVRLTLSAARGEIRPQISVFDVRMIDVLPTSQEPMRGFVDRMVQAEAAGEALSLSLIHGFMAGDSPNLGAKMIVITDNDQAAGEAMAERLGRELFGFRGHTRLNVVDAKTALQEAAASQHNKPVVIADIWDNPGGGVAGDSTHVLHEAIAQGVRDITFGTLWDPMAVRLCFAAGEGARLPLRFGGKTAQGGGQPVDAEVTVKKLIANSYQSFGESVVTLGDCALIEFGGIEVILNSTRAQNYSPDLFSNNGVAFEHRKILVIKSTNHFYGAFAPIAAEIKYVAVKGVYPDDPKTTAYKHLTRPIWPIVEDPHGM